MTERAGVINLGLEGAIIAGAFGALAGAGLAAGSAGVLAGFAAGALAGLATAALFAAFAVLLRADQIITGTAVTLAALGLTGTLYRTYYGAGGAALATPTSGPLLVPGLSAGAGGGARRVRPAGHHIRAVCACSGVMVVRDTYTRAGLHYAPWVNAAMPLPPRGSGRACAARCHALRRTSRRVSGATLVMAQAGTFAEGMSAGPRDSSRLPWWVLGRWAPRRRGPSLSLVFGAASALQYLFQSMGWALPYQLFLALPVRAHARGAGRSLAAGQRRRRARPARRCK
jgi:simple sugar transport system permease protein